MWYASKTATAAPERTASSPSSSPSIPRARVAGAAGLLLGALLAGCVPPPAAKTSPEPAKTEAAETAAAEPTPAPTPAPAPPPAAPKKPYEGREDIVVLDPGDEQAAASRSLVEAARAERQRRAQAGPPVAVITDKNLKQQATGQLTYAAPKAVEKASANAAAASPEQPVRDEQYWRSRALEIRVRWRKAADDMKELEQAAAGWRRRFYAERDTYVRDGQIKPEWDRVLDRLEEARAEVKASVQELEEFMEEGRREGALPGWLREGVDQEPQEEPEPSNQHEVIEPPKADGKGA